MIVYITSFGDLYYKLFLGGSSLVTWGLSVSPPRVPQYRLLCCPCTEAGSILAAALKAARNERASELVSSSHSLEPPPNLRGSLPVEKEGI